MRSPLVASWQGRVKSQHTAGLGSRSGRWGGLRDQRHRGIQPTALPDSPLCDRLPRVPEALRCGTRQPRFNRAVTKSHRQCRTTPIEPSGTYPFDPLVIRDRLIRAASLSRARPDQGRTSRSGALEACHRGATSALVWAAGALAAILANSLLQRPAALRAKAPAVCSLRWASAHPGVRAANRPTSELQQHRLAWSEPHCSAVAANHQWAGQAIKLF